MRRRYLVAWIALAGIAATWGLMLAFGWSAKLGIVTFAPWVALIGFDLGVVAGAAIGGIGIGLFLIASHADGVMLDGTQIGVRAGALAALGVGCALGGRRLRASETAYRSFASLQSALIDSTLDGICLTDGDGNILISNRPLRKLVSELGMPQHGTVPERLLAISSSITEPERYRQRMLELAGEPGEASTDEFEVAGTGRVFRGYTREVPGGEVGGRVWTLREVTADRELDRMRDAFVATVSHELRTPLTSISGFLEMMQDEEAGLGASGRQYLDVIRRSTARLHALVEDLLLVAQIEARRIDLTLAPVDLAEVAHRSVEAARPTAEEKGVAVEVHADHPPAVRGDQHRLGQVVDNLVSNAVKFTNEGGRVTVRVERDESGGAVRLTVADTGVGVPSEELGQIFSRFFRASTATRSAIPGTGLGLAISRALVEQHGGSITFASREGEGTDVTVSLPVTP